MNITSATQQGLRDYQEDRYVIHSTERGHLFAVMDGHSGSEVAEYCRQRIPEIWDGVFDPTLPEKSIAALFSILDDHTQQFRAGSAVSVVFIPKDSSTAHVGILGDAPVIAALSNHDLHISPEHNVRTNTAERQAAEARGGEYYNGYICRGHAGLQMSRALGDAPIRPILSQTPEVYSISIDGFLLVASDGVFDPGHSDTRKEIDAVVRLVSHGASAGDIVNRAIENQTGDNATAILIRM